MQWNSYFWRNESKQTSVSPKAKVVFRLINVNHEYLPCVEAPSNTVDASIHESC